MNNVDKLSYSIQKLQPNSEYILNINDDVVNENVFNSITWVTVNNLTWSEVLDEMEKL
tara:strand:+ start:516 stop:689 length:174 start_codon:yes stop_codon:yes gene_type:complete